MSSSHLILSRPLLLLPSIFPRNRVFFNESAICIRWPKYWSFSLSPFNEYSGLISFKMDWFGLVSEGWGVRGTALSWPLIPGPQGRWAEHPGCTALRPPLQRRPQNPRNKAERIRVASAHETSAIEPLSPTPQSTRHPRKREPVKREPTVT